MLLGPKKVLAEAKVTAGGAVEFSQATGGAAVSVIKSAQFTGVYSVKISGFDTTPSFRQMIQVTASELRDQQSSLLHGRRWQPGHRCEREVLHGQRQLLDGNSTAADSGFFITVTA